MGLLIGVFFIIIGLIILNWSKDPGEPVADHPWLLEFAGQLSYYPVDDNTPTRYWVSLWTAARIGVSAHFFLIGISFPLISLFVLLFCLGFVIPVCGWLLLGVEERVEELQENSAVVETSLLVSRTLGMEDSPSWAKEPLVDDGVESQPKKTFLPIEVTR
ncbi:hypothetical protein M9H77_36148 [Catharanthus roseus]|uniref:Uncharacterized protein n=1 Tax=Catharanthus roseus TaxID=4058 RepID=A0ACB9ZRT1_CATRO|nr:hypothetical protein M9H77_36148 [Catharanthus roseus]